MGARLHGAISQTTVANNGIIILKLRKYSVFNVLRTVTGQVEAGFLDNQNDTGEK